MTKKINTVVDDEEKKAPHGRDSQAALCALIKKGPMESSAHWISSPRSITFFNFTLRTNAT